jgi:23S rRNA-/tRNA-specific pseudouridylate synthase
MAVLADGAPCRTEWRVVERGRDCALVACKPITGRQHQIRVHLSAIGHAIVGDKLYGPDDTLFEKALEGTLDERDLELLGLPRQALHAHRIVFRTPHDGSRLEVLAPLPRDMADYLDERR